MTVQGFTNVQKLFFALTICFVVVTVVIFDSIVIQNVRKSPEDRLKPDPAPKTLLKAFHLDLKGAPPNLQYLKKILPIIRSAGANAILIEYEDMFPFTGNLSNISAKNAYLKWELNEFVDFAESLKMEVIPLVQTFGHLEYALKLEEFRHLRELEGFPQEICPSKKNAVDFIKEIIAQVMTVHIGAKYIHIGCDEVRHLAACVKCSRIGPRKAFGRHVMKIADFVKEKYPGVTPLIWDDMLRGWNFKELANSGLGTAVEPVVWAYARNIFTLVPASIWNKYQKIFPRIWVASAFKGASNEKQIVPDIDLHLQNNQAWKKIIYSNNTYLKFKQDIFSGIFLTGWSRYDHFAVLCELLPVAIPSLMLSLLSLEDRFDSNDLSTWSKILNCREDFPKLNEVKKNVLNCSFPGSDLYEVMIRFKSLKKRAEHVFYKVDSSAWFSMYNLKENFTNPWRLLQMFPEEGVGGQRLLREMVNLRLSTVPIMLQYFDKFTTNEWVEENFRPIEGRLKELFDTFRKLLNTRTWPRRPFR